MAFDITERPPTKYEIEQLLVEANRSPFITGMSLREVDKLVEAGTLRFGYVEGQCIGYGGWMVINEMWCETGPFFLAENARGKGFGGQLATHIIETCQEAGFHQYGVSKNPAMKRLFESAGFEPVGWLQLPLVVYAHLIQRTYPLRTIRALGRLSPEPVSHYILKNEP